MVDRHIEPASDIYNFYIKNSTATFAEAELTVEEFRQNVIFSDPRLGSFVVESRLDHQLLGYCTLTLFRPRLAYRQTGEISIYLHPDHTGKGLGKLAADKLEKFAKLQNFHALIAAVCAESVESIRLFESIGYKHVAELKEVGYKFGRYLDVIYFEKILEG